MGDRKMANKKMGDRKMDVTSFCPHLSVPTCFLRGGFENEER
jgi:hypothetical protein